MERSIEYAPAAKNTARALRCFGKSAFTLFHTPSHETLHVDSERLSCGNYQPMMPSIQEMTEELHALLLQREPLVVANCLGRADMMMLSGALIQFSDHSGITSNDLEIIPDFSSIARLKDVFVARSARDGCLNAVQQFDEALQLAGDDIGRVLMLLWAASRQYARWLDSNMLLNELTTKMIGFMKCKSGGVHCGRIKLLIEDHKIRRVTRITCGRMHWLIMLGARWQQVTPYLIMLRLKFSGMARR